VADAYATLCGEGIHAQQHIVEMVKGANGGQVSIKKIDVSADPVVLRARGSPTCCVRWRTLVTNGTGQRAAALGRPVAGKTGTHQSLTAWFNGCTPQIATSVVYFKGDGTESLDGSAGLSTFFGAIFPPQTWETFMAGALAGKPVVDFKIGKGIKPSRRPRRRQRQLRPGCPSPRPRNRRSSSPRSDRPADRPAATQTNAHVHAQADPDANA